MSITLTKHAISAIYAGQTDALPAVNPVLQVLNLKLLQTSGGASGAPPRDRYRLFISDGEHYMQGMLATQKNDLITSGQLVRFCVVRVKSYTTSLLGTRRVAAIIDLDVLASPGVKIDNPVPIESPDGTNTGASAATGNSNTVQTPTNGQPSAGRFNQQQTTPAPQTHGSYGQQSPASASNTFQTTPQATRPPQTPQFGQPFSGAGRSPQQLQFNSTSPFQSDNRFGNSTPNMAPSTFHGAPASVLPIKSLNPYQNRWTIRARVTQKSDIKYWHNARGEGKLFNVNLLDESGEIRATAFNDQVDRLYNVLTPGNVYYISLGRITMAKQQYSSVQNEYEIAFENQTQVELCSDAAAVPFVRFNFVEISKIADVEKDSVIDVIGVVKECHEVSQIISKTTQRPVSKRDLTLVDTSHFSIRVTLWGEKAENFQGHDHPVVAFKGVRVSDFGGRSLSMYSSSTMQVDPDIPEAHRLRGWFDSQGSTEQYQTFNSAALGGGLAAGSSPATGMLRDDFKTISQVQDAGFGMGDKPDYFMTRATVVFIKQDTIAYPACPTEGCNKKVIEEGPGAWRCEKCDRTYPAPEYRYIVSINVSDHTGNLWVQCFNDIGQQIIGKSANDLIQLKDMNDSDYAAVFQEANFHTYLLRCRAKQETYNDTTRVRYSVLSATPINFAQHGRQMLDLVQKM